MAYVGYGITQCNYCPDPTLGEISESEEEFIKRLSHENLMDWDESTVMCSRCAMLVKNYENN